MKVSSIIFLILLSVGCDVSAAAGTAVASRVHAPKDIPASYMRDEHDVWRVWVKKWKNSPLKDQFFTEIEQDLSDFARSGYPFYVSGEKSFSLNDRFRFISSVLMYYVNLSPEEKGTLLEESLPEGLVLQVVRGVYGLLMGLTEKLPLQQNGKSAKQQDIQALISAAYALGKIIGHDRAALGVVQNFPRIISRLKKTDEEKSAFLQQYEYLYPLLLKGARYDVSAYLRTVRTLDEGKKRWILSFTDDQLRSFSAPSLKRTVLRWGGELVHVDLRLIKESLLPQLSAFSGDIDRDHYISTILALYERREEILKYLRGRMDDIRHKRIIPSKEAGGYIPNDCDDAEYFRRVVEDYISGVERQTWGVQDIIAHWGKLPVFESKLLAFGADIAHLPEREDMETFFTMIESHLMEGARLLTLAAKYFQTHPGSPLLNRFVYDGFLSGACIPARNAKLETWLRDRLGVGYQASVIRVLSGEYHVSSSEEENCYGDLGILVGLYRSYLVEKAVESDPTLLPHHTDHIVLTSDTYKRLYTSEQVAQWIFKQVNKAYQGSKKPTQKRNAGFSSVESIRNAIELLMLV